MAFIRPTLFLAALALAACSTSTTIDYQTLHGKNRASIAAMYSARPVEIADLRLTPWSEARKLDIGAGNDVMAMPGGVTYVELVALPEDASGRLLVIKSFPSFNRPVSVFVPNVTFLDVDRAVLKTEDAVQYRPIASMFGDHLLGEVRVPPRAASVLISTDDAKIGTRHDFKERPLINQDPDERDLQAGYASRDGGLGSSYEGRVGLSLE